MKINCLHCGHSFGIDHSYADYEGLLKCGTCGELLDVRIDDGMVKSVRPGSFHAPPPQPQEQIQPHPQQLAQPYHHPQHPQAHQHYAPQAHQPPATHTQAYATPSPNAQAPTQAPIEAHNQAQGPVQAPSQSQAVIAAKPDEAPAHAPTSPTAHEAELALDEIVQRAQELGDV